MQDAPKRILLDVRRLRSFMEEQVSRNEDTVTLIFDDRHNEEMFRCCVQVALNLMYNGNRGITESVINLARSLRTREEDIFAMVRDVANEVLHGIQENFHDRVFDCGLLYKVSYIRGNHVELELQRR